MTDSRKACERADRFLEENGGYLEEQRAVLAELEACRDRLLAQVAHIETRIEALTVRAPWERPEEPAGEEGEDEGSLVEDEPEEDDEPGDDEQDESDDEEPAEATRGPEKGSIRDEVLQAIGDKPGSTARDLAQATGLSMSQVRGALKGLRRSELIEAAGQPGETFRYFLAEDDEDDSPAPGSTRFLS